MEHLDSQTEVLLPVRNKDEVQPKCNCSLEDFSQFTVMEEETGKAEGPNEITHSVRLSSQTHVPNITNRKDTKITRQR